jgi:hypothetical protein
MKPRSIKVLENLENHCRDACFKAYNDFFQFTNLYSPGWQIQVEHPCTSFHQGLHGETHYSHPIGVKTNS